MEAKSATTRFKRDRRIADKIKKSGQKKRRKPKEASMVSERSRRRRPSYASMASDKRKRVGIRKMGHSSRKRGFQVRSDAKGDARSERWRKSRSRRLSMTWTGLGKRRKFTKKKRRMKGEEEEDMRNGSVTLIPTNNVRNMCEWGYSGLTPKKIGPSASLGPKLNEAGGNTNGPGPFCVETGNNSPSMWFRADGVNKKPEVQLLHEEIRGKAANGDGAWNRTLSAGPNVLRWSFLVCYNPLCIIDVGSYVERFFIFSLSRVLHLLFTSFPILDHDLRNGLFPIGDSLPATPILAHFFFLGSPTQYEQKSELGPRGLFCGQDHCASRNQSSIFFFCFFNLVSNLLSPIIHFLAQGIEGLFEEEKIDWVSVYGKFLSLSEILVDTIDGGKAVVNGRHIMITISVMDRGQKLLKTRCLEAGDTLWADSDEWKGLMSLTRKRSVTSTEDKCWIVTIHNFGWKWKQVSKHAPGGTLSQCRDKCLNGLDPLVKLGGRMVEEDSRVEVTIAKHGSDFFPLIRKEDRKPYKNERWMRIVNSVADVSVGNQLLVSQELMHASLEDKTCLKGRAMMGRMGAKTGSDYVGSESSFVDSNRWETPVCIAGCGEQPKNLARDNGAKIYMDSTNLGVLSPGLFKVGNICLTRQLGCAFVRFFITIHMHCSYPSLEGKTDFKEEVLIQPKVK